MPKKYIFPWTLTVACDWNLDAKSQSHTTVKVYRNIHADFHGENIYVEIHVKFYVNQFQINIRISAWISRWLPRGYFHLGVYCRSVEVPPGDGRQELEVTLSLGTYILEQN